MSKSSFPNISLPLRTKADCPPAMPGVPEHVRWTEAKEAFCLAYELGSFSPHRNGGSIPSLSSASSQEGTSPYAVIAINPPSRAFARFLEAFTV